MIWVSVNSSKQGFRLKCFLINSFRRIATNKVFGETVIFIKRLSVIRRQFLFGNSGFDDSLRHHHSGPFYLQKINEIYLSKTILVSQNVPDSKPNAAVRCFSDSPSSAAWTFPPRKSSD